MRSTTPARTEWQPNVTRLLRVADGAALACTYIGASDDTRTGRLAIIVQFDGESTTATVDAQDVIAILDDPLAVSPAAADPFAGIRPHIPIPHAPGQTSAPYDYPNPDAWYPVIYYFAGTVEPYDGPAWLVEPYPAARADGTDGQDPIDSAGVAVLRGAAAPTPHGPDPLGDWTITGRAPRNESAYDVHVTTPGDLMAAWCEAWAIATALNNGTATALGLEAGDVEVLLAAERGALIGDSRYVGTINELRWLAIGAWLNRTVRVPATQTERLRTKLAAIEASTTQTRHPRMATFPADAPCWVETRYGLSRSGKRILAEMRASLAGAPG